MSNETFLLQRTTLVATTLSSMRVNLVRLGERLVFLNQAVKLTTIPFHGPISSKKLCSLLPNVLHYCDRNSSTHTCITGIDTQH